MEKSAQEHDSLYQFFIPLTTKKAILFLSLIGFLVYFTILFNGFAWDDYTYIVNNSDIHMLNLLRLFGKSTFNQSGFYRPITAVYFAIIYHFFGLKPFYYHFFQLLLHILNACMLFFIFKRFFPKAMSFVFSLIFLIHPIQVESVAFISASLSELFFFFGISALLLSQKSHKQIYDILISILLLCSALSKETGILFYGIVLINAFFFEKRTIKSLTTYAATSLALYIFIRFSLAHVYLTSDTYIPLGHLTLLQRLVNIPAIFMYYIQTLFYPVTLSIDQLWTVPSLDATGFFIPLFIDCMFIVLLGLVGFFCFRKNKESCKVYFFFLLWFLSGMLLILQVFPLDLTVSDRWIYFPIVGLLGIIGIGFKNAPKPNNSLRYIGICLVSVILIFYAIRTIIRDSNWQSDFAINSHDEKITTNFDLENNLGVDYLAQGQCLQAKVHFAKSVMFSQNDVNLDNLALANACLKHYILAKIEFIKSIHAPSYLVDTSHKHFLALYINVINFFVLDGYSKEGLIYIKLAMNDYPHTSILYHYFAADEYLLGNKQYALIIEKKANSLPQTIGYIDAYSYVLKKHM